MQFAALKLHHVDVGAKNRLAKALEIFHRHRRHRKIVIHHIVLSIGQDMLNRTTSTNEFNAPSAATDRRETQIQSLWSASYGAPDSLPGKT